MTADTILHLVSAAEFEALPTTAPYLPSNFAEDGFIHCTRGQETLLAVANAFYREAPGHFLVLVIDPAKLSAPLRDEAPSPAPPADSGLAGTTFPHIYGPLNRSAIVGVRHAERAPDGTFLRV